MTNNILQRLMVTLTCRPLKFGIKSKIAFAHSSSARCRSTEFFPFAGEREGQNNETYSVLARGNFNMKANEVAAAIQLTQHSG